jgi:hypothetical protein
VVCFRERFQTHMAALENYGHNIHFCGHLCVHVRGHFTAAAVASGAPIWQAVWRRG